MTELCHDVGKHYGLDMKKTSPNYKAKAPTVLPY